MSETKKVTLKPGEEYITLGQLLKFIGIVERGSDVKSYLQEHSAKVDGRDENRRGAKLRPGMKIEIPEGIIVEICASND